MASSRRDFLKKSATVAATLGAAAALPFPMSATCNKKRKFKPAKRVIIFTFDGIRVDGLKKANTPYIDSLISSGAASFATRDVMPSVTLPNYTSHLLGAGPEVHGVDNNDWTVDHFRIPAVVRDEDGYFPNVFQELKKNVPGIRSAFYYNWEPIINPHNRKYIDVGHTYEWMSPEYIRSIEESDAEIGRVIEMLKADGLYEDSHLMFISDHGGVGRGHGGVSEAEMIVPWVIEGPGIKKGFEITEPNNTVNTASTVLSLFGVKQPLCWTGEVPRSIFIEK